MPGFLERNRLDAAALGLPIVQRLLTEGRTDLLDCYSDACLRRVWQAIRFSWWFTLLMHNFDDPIGHRLQLAELDYLTNSVAGSTTLAENYVGLPFATFE